MADQNRTILSDVGRAWDWFLAIEQVERCNRAIKQYADLGISGDPHDLEHRKMRDEAIQLARKIRA